MFKDCFINLNLQGTAYEVYDLSVNSSYLTAEPIEAFRHEFKINRCKFADNLISVIDKCVVAHFKSSHIKVHKNSQVGLTFDRRTQVVVYFWTKEKK